MTTCRFQVNQRRKLRQDAAAPKLTSLEREYAGLTEKTVEIEVACQLLQLEVDGLEARAAALPAASSAGARTDAAAPHAANGVEVTMVE